GAPGRVDVHRDVLVGILRLEMKQLRHDQVGDLVVHRRAEKDDALVEQPAVDVERALPAGGLLDDHRYQWAHGLALSRLLRRNPATTSPASAGTASASFQ